MKRLALILAFALSAAGFAAAQNIVTVNSEKIFKSIKKYNDAIAQLDTLAQEYQKQVDAKFREVETLYNNYMAQKTSLSRNAGTPQRCAISCASAKSAPLSATDGSLMKRRIELIQPIQKQVFGTIEAYAKEKGIDMVIDIAQNATMLYYSPASDHTQAIIDRLKAAPAATAEAASATQQQTAQTTENQQ